MHNPVRVVFPMIRNILPAVMGHDVLIFWFVDMNLSLGKIRYATGVIKMKMRLNDMLYIIPFVTELLNLAESRLIHISF